MSFADVSGFDVWADTNPKLAEASIKRPVIAALNLYTLAIVVTFYILARFTPAASCSNRPDGSHVGVGVLAERAALHAPINQHQAATPDRHAPVRRVLL